MRGMEYPKAYIDYLVYFHGLRDYFECHEVLEEQWKKDRKEERKKYWVGLIQIAVSLYHHRRGNFKGATTLIKKAIENLQREKAAIESLALHYERLLTLLKIRYTDLINRKSFKDIDLPIVSESLIEVCKEECELLNCTWGSESDLSNEYVVNKHRLRDRSIMIAEREKQKKKRS